MLKMKKLTRKEFDEIDKALGSVCTRIGACSNNCPLEADSPMGIETGCLVNKIEHLLRRYAMEEV